jgi:Fur family ferric uptake transcriptional regulator
VTSVLQPEALEARIRDARLRPTRQRKLVLAALAAEPNDATAQGIHRRLHAEGHPVGLATVYRALAALSERGVVDALSHRPGETCYRLCSDEHHHHLVCSTCHRVVELPECELDPWVERMSARHGFLAEEHRLEINGVCSSCRN